MKPKDHVIAAIDAMADVSRILARMDYDNPKQILRNIESAQSILELADEAFTKIKTKMLKELDNE